MGPGQRYSHALALYSSQSFSFDRFQSSPALRAARKPRSKQLPNCISPSTEVLPNRLWWWCFKKAPDRPINAGALPRWTDQRVSRPFDLSPRTSQAALRYTRNSVARISEECVAQVPVDDEVAGSNPSILPLVGLFPPLSKHYRHENNLAQSERNKCLGSTSHCSPLNC